MPKKRPGGYAPKGVKQSAGRRKGGVKTMGMMPKRRRKR